MDLSALQNTLPANSPLRRKTHTPPHSTTIASTSASHESEADLLQAFKAAATSVTLLYKKCAASTDLARTEGYYDALSEVLEVVDNEAYTDPSVALLRIREWLIEHRRKTRREMSAESDEDERVREQVNMLSKREDQAVKPQQLTVPMPSHLHPQNVEPIRHGSTPTTPLASPRIMPFAFQPIQSLPAYPTDVEVDILSDKPQSPTLNLPPPHTGIFQFNAPPQQPGSSGLARASSQKQGFSSRGNQQQQLGPGAGNKRRLQMGDFFDISGIVGPGNWNGREGGGGKRGRHL